MGPLDENRGELLDLSLGDDVLNLTPKTKVTKAKINKWDHVKPESSQSAKETAHNCERQPTRWETVFANHLSV